MSDCGGATIKELGLVVSVLRINYATSYTSPIRHFRDGYLACVFLFSSTKTLKQEFFGRLEEQKLRQCASLINDIDITSNSESVSRPELWVYLPDIGAKKYVDL